MQAEKEAAKQFDLTGFNTGDRFNAVLFGTMVQKGFSKLYRDKTLTDLTLVVDGEKIPVHKLVLCAWSDTFRAMLSESSWLESSLKELPVRDVEGDDVAHFKHMIEYMYTGDVDFITEENVIPLIGMTNYYGVLSLKEVCGQLLAEQISEDNLLFLLDVVDKYDCRQLATACGGFVAKNFQRMLEENDERLFELKEPIWEGMLMSSDLKARSEQSVYEAVLRYADKWKDDPERRDGVLNMLLPRIRWIFIAPHYLVETVETNESLFHLPLFHTLLHDTYKFFALGSLFQPKSFDCNPRTGFQRFAKDRSSTQIVFSNDMLTAQLPNSASVWCGIVCEQPFTDSYSYCEFNIDSSAGSHAIGVVYGESMENNSSLTQLTNATICNCSGGQIWAHGATMGSSGQSWTTGDRIGVRLELESSKFEVFKNGVSLTFCTLPPKPTGVKTPFYYPVIYVSNNDKFTLLPQALIPLKS